VVSTHQLCPRYEKDPDGLAAVYPGPILDLGNGEGARAPFPLRPQYSAIGAPIQVFGA
jgi:hypothetical protein